MHSALKMGKIVQQQICTLPRVPQKRLKLMAFFQIFLVDILASIGFVDKHLLRLPQIAFFVGF